MGANAANAVCFGAFEVDRGARQLRKSGARVRLQELPFRLLLMLLEKPGEVVTRDELRRELWPNTQFGDFDDGLGTAVRKLRKALGDSATHPRFIETVPKVGYRFVSEVRDVVNGAEPMPEPVASASGSRSVMLAAGALVVIAGLALWISVWRAGGAARLDGPERLLSFVEDEPQLRQLLIDRGLSSGPQISPDGEMLVYVAGESLWVRDLASVEARLLVGPGEALSGRYVSPVWSPDSSSIAFGRGGSILAVGLADGGVRTICNHCIGAPVTTKSTDWSPDGRWIVSVVRNRLLRVHPAGGEPELLYELEGTAVLAHPIVLPAGQVVFSVLAANQDPEMMVLDPDTGQTSSLVAGLALAYTRTEHLIYRTNSLGIWALPVTHDGRKSGDAFQIRRDAVSASVSDDGTLVFHVPRRRLMQLEWRDRDGNPLNRFGQPLTIIGFPRISPDGRSVAAEDGGTGDIWIHETGREIARRLRNPGIDGHPAWTHDGRKIAFFGELPGQYRSARIFERNADGSGDLAPLTTSEDASHPKPVEYFENFPNYSPDGKIVIFHSMNRGTQRDLYYVRVEPDGSYRSHVFLRTPYNERDANFSPDGRFVAYGSDTSGREEIYVAEFPSGANRQQVSVNGGRKPRWRGDGRELLFVEPAGPSLMAAAVQTEPSFSFREPERLFDSQLIWSGKYDVTYDGRKIVVVELLGEDVHVPATTYLWQNWFSSLQ